MDQYIRKNDYETTSFDGEWIILNTDNYTITRLNGTGGFCWSLLGEAQSVQSLSNAVARKFSIELKAVEEDVVAFLDNLVQCELVQYASF